MLEKSIPQLKWLLENKFAKSCLTAYNRYKEWFMYKYTIVESEIGYQIYINLISSSAGHYLSRRPYVMNLLKEVLANQKLRGERVIVERDMGRDIGNTDIVVTSEKDTIYYAKPLKNIVFSRFAKNRYPQPSQKLTLILARDQEGNYEVLDTWIGPSKPPFPGDELATDDSRDYWLNHALVHDAQMIQTKTITKDCPY